MAKLAMFQSPIFQDETKARKALEAVRWPDGPFCPHCGSSHPDQIAKVEGKKQSHRPGLFYCNDCKGQFTVTVGTVFERSKVPLTKWWMAAHMLNSGKNGVSAHEIHRTIGVTYKTAWFMMHRLREAMSGMSGGAMGGSGHSVQADETDYTMDELSEAANDLRRETVSIIRFFRDSGIAPAIAEKIERANKDSSAGVSAPAGSPKITP